MKSTQTSSPSSSSSSSSPSIKTQTQQLKSKKRIHSETHDEPINGNRNSSSKSAVKHEHHHDDDDDANNHVVIDDNENEDMIIDSNSISHHIHTQQQQSSSTSTVPSFPSFKPSNITSSATSSSSSDRMYMRITVPPHRYTPLRNEWLSLYQPIVEHMKLQIRFNIKKRCIELRTSTDTIQQNALTKSYDYIRAYIMGFEIRDAIALLRLDDLYIDSFEIKDVKTLEGEHLSRAIGRIAGVGGKTRYSIENATRTRIVIADTHIHILGTYSNIQIAKNAIVRLIMGSPPSKVYTQMRAVATRQKQRF